IAPVAGENNRVAVTNRSERSKAHHHQSGLTRSHTEWTATGYEERSGGRNLAGESQAAEVDYLKSLRPARSGNDCAEVQVGRIGGQQRRQVSRDDIIGPRETVRADRAGDGQEDSVGTGLEVSMREAC